MDAKLIKFMPRSSGLYRALTTGVLVFTLSACSIFQAKTHLSHVVIDSDPRINDDSPVAVDIVAIMDEKLVNRVQSLSARQWFTSRQQLLNDYPDLLLDWSLELVPDSHFSTDDNPLNGKPASAIILFARYGSDGDHRLSIDGHTSLYLHLQANEITLSSAPSQG